MLKKIFHRFNDLYLIPIRVGLGWVFMAHGGQKLFGWWGGSGLHGFAGSLESMGMKPAFVWAVLAALQEFIGGFMVLLGIFSRWGALFLIGVMIFAIILVHGKNGFFLMNRGYEYNMVLIAMALCILFKGSGPYSIKGD